MCCFSYGYFSCFRFYNSLVKWKSDYRHRVSKYNCSDLGALIIKEQQLFERKLKVRYPYIDFNIQWHDEVSGSVINNNMLAHKYQIGYMGDMPSIINLYNGYLHEEYNSRLLAIDGKG